MFDETMPEPETAPMGHNGPPEDMPEAPDWIGRAALPTPPPPPPGVPGAPPWDWRDGPDKALTITLMAVSALCLAITWRIAKEGL